MRPLDWYVLIGCLALVVGYGTWRGRGSNTVNKYMLAGNSMPWYAIAFSIMATQASAITFISTTGQSYVDGMRFVQFYFGLPIAMIILSVTLVPLFHRAKVYTAYEYLEQRFDAKTRALASVIFLIERGLADRYFTLRGGHRAEHHPGLAGSDHDLDRGSAGASLHHDGRCGGRHMDRIPSNDRHDLWSFGRADRGAVAASSWSQSAWGGESGRSRGKTAHAGAAIQLERSLQHLERIVGRNVSGARVFRMRPEPGSALSHGQVAQG